MDFILIIVVLAVLGVAGAASLGRNWHEHRSIDHYSEAMGRLRDLARDHGINQAEHTGPREPGRRTGAAAATGATGTDRLISSPSRGAGRADSRSSQEARVHAGAPGPAAVVEARLPRVDVPGAVGARGAPDSAAPARAEVSGSSRGTSTVAPLSTRTAQVSGPADAGPRHRKVGAPAPGDVTDPAVEANARLTATTGLLLVLLFFIEGLTLPVVGRYLSWHVAIGLALIPVVGLKLGTTMWRFAHYYLGDRRYVRAGPPHPVLRALGPVVILSTVGLIGSGVALWLAGPGDATMLRIHQLTFVLWFGAVAVHLLAHVLRATRLAAADRRDSRRPKTGLPGARTRRLVVVVSLVAGIAVGLASVTVTTGWTHPNPPNVQPPAAGVTTAP